MSSRISNSWKIPGRKNRELGGNTIEVRGLCLMKYPTWKNTY